MKRKNNSGEIVVEASIIVTLTVMFITIMFYIGMVLYQQSLVSIMANQTASNIAQVYGNALKDPFTGYVNSDNVYQSITYTNMKTDAYMQVIEQKADTLAIYRLKSSRILSTGSPKVEVEIVKKQNELLKSQVVVTIHDKYALPLVSLFGVDNTLAFSSTGRADCVDLLEYLNGVEAIGDPESGSGMIIPNRCLVNFYENKFGGKLVATVPVERGKSILSSNYYTHSTMPRNPIHSGWRFTGWCLDNGNSFTASTQVDANLNVYGSWECTITFHPEGGSVNPTSKKVTVGTSTQLPTPNRDGYSFIGWFTGANGSGTQYFSNSTVITDNVDLYAFWQCIHNYIVERTIPGNCQTREINFMRCTRCGDAYQAEGNFGGHVFGSSNLVKAGTCVQRSRYRRTCTLCGYSEEYDGGYGNHMFEGKCGKDHVLGNDSYNLLHSDGKYYKMTKGECVTCLNCNAMWNGKLGADEQAGWTTRNGVVVSKGMYCKEHIWSDGKKHSDGSRYTDRIVTHLHG